jgi:hypothetical protein
MPRKSSATKTHEHLHKDGSPVFFDCSRFRNAVVSAGWR